MLNRDTDYQLQFFEDDNDGLDLGEYADSEEEEEEELVEEGDFSYLPVEKREVFIERAQLSVFEMHRRFTRGDIILRPIYQRGIVWPNPKKAKLLESILINISIPSVYLAETVDGKWEVVDGQQRLNSLFSFLEDSYKLTSLPVLSNLNNKTFSDLDAKYQRKIEDYQMHIFIIKKESHPDIRFNIFERINEGATQLNAQELRNCTYMGKPIELLDRLSNTYEFKRVTEGKALQVKRLKHHEAVLRFLSFYVHGYRSYNGNMNTFLNETLDSFSKYSIEVNEFESVFRETMDTIFEVFEENAFVKSGAGRRKLNFALFDIVTYSFTRFDTDLIIEHKDEIVQALESLELNNYFDHAISANTLTRDNVITRFKFWMRTMEEILGVEESSL